MTVKMAETLSGLPQAGSILAELMRNNYFIDQRYLKEPVYQYHPLFRTFLRKQAKAHFSPEPFEDLNQRAVQMLETAGQIEEAFILARKPGTGK